MTRKLWFQLSIGILLSLLVLKYFIELKWIFTPLFVIAKTIFVPLLIGGVCFYLTVPIQTFLEKRKVPRWGSISIILLLITGIIWAAIAIVGPRIMEQFYLFVDHLPMIIIETNYLISAFMEQTGNMPNWTIDMLNDITDKLKSFSGQAGTILVTFFQSLIQWTVVLFVAPFFLFFMLKDHEKFVPFVTKFFSGDMQKWVIKTVKDIDNTLSLYIRGQLLISFILAIMLFSLYSLLGLNFALLLALFAFVMNIIPFIGPWVAFFPALLISYFQDPVLVIWVSLITLFCQQIDANLITPNIMGKTLKIHPLTIITVLFTAGKIAGFVGILLAIPAYAVGKVVVSNIFDKRREIKQAMNKTL